MRVVFGLLSLLLLGLCGSGAHGMDGVLTEELETEQTTKETTTDIWVEVKALRDMVVELRVKLSATEDKVQESESQVDELRAELIVTKMHVEMLQTENSAQATKLEALETRLTQTESTTSELKEENAAQASKLESLETRLTLTESTTSKLEEETADLQSELLLSTSRIDQLETENTEKPQVAFHAGLTDSGNIGPHSTDSNLKFTKVITNIGNAYNPSTGFFTAPVKGVYHLQFTVAGNRASPLIGLFMFMNDRFIMYSFEPTDSIFQYITKSVVLELNAGDEIHLVLPGGYSLYDNTHNHSTFSGFLLFPQ
ncbi:heavy metal-binding protein HIP-like [Notolabrus celidotus]|uniref:heavy metal-binding protein HIP-like n=1 Tax=Notolabrus celidotus TaxID=1203425 RepID=UPI00148FD567|nr:heavy metal-binding protein HIP-like [Notolabrus celidotus]